LTEFSETSIENHQKPSWISSKRDDFDEKLPGSPNFSSEPGVGVGVNINNTILVVSTHLRNSLLLE